MMNKNMIILARESRGLTQLELAAKINMSNTNLSKIENGDIGISNEVVALIAIATCYPRSFFEQQNEIYPEHLVYRKKNKVAQKILIPINAKVNIVRFHIQHLIRTLRIKYTTIPFFEVTELNTPAIIAQKLRNTWKVDQPVIDNVTKLMEDQGIVIVSFDFGTERVDSKCFITVDKYPGIIFNRAILGERQKFSLAYQLGHLIMHTYKAVNWERDITKEARNFADEFLMPEKEISKDFENGISITLLGELKRKWKVSMISLLYRADDLGYLTNNQRRYLLQQFNEMKIRRREPIELDVPVEKPTLLRNWFNELKINQKFDVKGITSLLHLNSEEFIELYS